MNKITFIVIVVVVAILAFWGGTVYKAKDCLVASQNQSQTETVKPKNPGGTKGGTVGGELVSKADGSIVLKSGNGKEAKDLTVNVTSETTFTKIVDANSSDMTVGNRIIANGSFGDNGVINAKSIEINQATPKETKKASSEPAQTNK